MKQRIIALIQAWIGAFTRKVLGAHVYAVIAKTDNGIFALDPEDCGVGLKLRMKGKYGADEIERLRRHLTPESRVLIVGAHLGTLAIPISQLCRKVVAIEANPATYQLLTLNITLNAAANCQAINIAASGKAEDIEMLLSRANSGGSKRVPLVKKFMYYSDRPEKITVKAFRLDDYLEEKGFDVIVMDIEGSEYFALQGMPEIVAQAKVLVVEFLPHHLKNVSGASVEQFLSCIAPHFTRLTIPSKGLVVDSSEFVAQLTRMYELGEEDDGILFEKI